MKVHRRKSRSVFVRVIHSFAVIVGAVALAVACFLVLPVIQQMNAAAVDVVSIASIDTVDIPPPPPPPEEEKEEEEEKPEENPPELEEEPPPPLDLKSLEDILNTERGIGGVSIESVGQLRSFEEVAEQADSIFDSAEIDDRPRAVHQPSPVLDRKARERAPGTVHVIFVVGTDGRVENPTVQRSSDPIFDKPALAAVRQWRFEPGKVGGRPVKVRMRVPITFPKGS
ncbi:MAG TPA: energy transducer TonB [Phycisphaerales bacterium]|nr:energy transducer TonB [Phycisphaerales bacterium]HMP38147.1 energy transducer TonB [Phycisphaerales bacterium]